MYKIQTDSRYRMIQITLSGFIKPDELERFITEEQAAAAEMKGLFGSYVTLVDTTGLKLQSQDILAAFQNFIDNAPHKARKIALVVGQSLSRMQARRLLSNNRLRTFDTMDEATDWLIEPGIPLENKSA